MDAAASTWASGLRLARSTTCPSAAARRCLAAVRALSTRSSAAGRSEPSRPFREGLPFTVGAEDVQGANNTYAERADLNLAHPPAGFVKNHQHYYSFSTTPLDPGAQYTQPRPGYFGTSQRNSLSGPGQINFDLSAFKNFRIFESLGFQFRVDAFNVLNHWNPGQPDANIFDSTAGQILPPTRRPVRVFCRPPKN